MGVMSSLLGVFYGLSRETEQMSKKNLHASQLRCSNGLTVVGDGGRNHAGQQPDA
jgi:hypothetical protein